MAWFDNSDIYRDFPVLYRLHAVYSRAVLNRSTHRVRGGSFLLRRIIQITNAFGLKDSAPAHLDADTVMFVDLFDPRMLDALQEASDQSSHEHRVIRASVGEGDTFLDVGANHGSYAVFAADLVGATGMVVAFEPQPRLAELIRKSLTANRVGRWEVHQVACSDHEAQAEFFVPAAGSGSASVFREYAGIQQHRRFTVRLAPLDRVADWESYPGQIFIKLDVEGSELAFLRGAQRLIRRRRPAILFELNPDSAQAAGYSADELFECFGELGYDRFAEIDKFPEALPRNEVDRTRMRNLVALPQAE